MSEEEIGPHPHLGDAQPVDQHRPHERLGIPAGQVRREADDRDAIDAGALERLELLRLGHEQRRRLVGPDDARRVRVEGHHDRRGVPLIRNARKAIEDLAVAAVQAVEVAERQHRLHPAHRPRIVGEVNDVHELRTLRGPPQWASFVVVQTPP